MALDFDALYRTESRRVFAMLLRLLGDFNLAEEALSEDEALQPVATATTVRVRGGKATVTDGPFAETKECLAGFYMIEARDLNEASQIASRIPPAGIGSVEVRPVRGDSGGAECASHEKVLASAWNNWGARRDEVSGCRGRALGEGGEGRRHQGRLARRRRRTARAVLSEGG